MRFGLGDREQKPVLFDLAAGSLADAPGASAGLTPARVDGLPVTDWENSYEPKFQGGKIGLQITKYLARSQCGPTAPASHSGLTYWLRAFDAAGKPTWRQPGPGMAWGIDYSADGRILAVAYVDGTIRWLRGSDGQELLAFFVERPRADGSPGRPTAITWRRPAARI